MGTGPDSAFSFALCFALILLHFVRSTPGKSCKSERFLPVLEMDDYGVYQDLYKQAAFVCLGRVVELP
jgi:hypothetical protein